MIRLLSTLPAGLLMLMFSETPDLLIPGIERLTLSAAALLAVGILWRAMDKRDLQFREIVERKDRQLTEITGVVTAALTLAAETNREMHAALKESVDAKHELTSEIKALAGAIGRMPCSVPSPYGRISGS